ncbi:penicillin-binding transpeptidase domain-containing protein [Phytoactinopolyspora limicola]|uniref:penicillin-binding transpeptidase domain-containing protein n=1 Tax=Phytoactinopolyspora limicola TaxID=2715536 RepID=UPI001A9CA05C|nr:penicillin-binding transpeptidase domain-containing protein [Phytoactinopolyspora limicola]
MNSDRKAASRGARGTRGRVAAGIVSAGLLLVSCSGDDTPEPDPAAEALAEALASGEFGAVALADASAEDVEAQIEQIVDGMGDTARSVELRALTPDDENGDGWVATYSITWQLAGGPGGGGTGADDDAGADDDGDDAGADDDGADDGADGDGSDTGEWSYTTTTRWTLVGDGDEQSWQTDWSPALLHPDLSAGDRLRLRRQTPGRGDILGAGGAVLVTERDVYRIGIDKTTFDEGATGADMAASAEALADVVDVDPTGLSERVAAAGDRAFVDAVTLRRPDAEPLLSDIAAIDGAVALQDTMHLAPTREFARPVLGAAGEATAEIIEESDGRVRTGDIVGLSGLQRHYDEQLRGTPGFKVELVPEDGDPSTIHERPAVDGADLTTTLSMELQAHAEAVLADVAPASAIVAVQPSTGHVLAAASGPGGEGYSTATLGQYAPGSTFKVATALALLRSGLTPDTSVECPPTTNIDGREFGNYSAYPASALGTITLETAVAESCNTAFIDLNAEVPQSALAEAAASLGLGLGNEAEVGVPVFLGTVPDEADGTMHAASMIGQGQLLTSPLGMATVAASVEAGHAVVPRLVDRGDAVEADPPTPLTDDEAEQLRQMMSAAVERGSASFLQSVPGEPVGAKTGTAEYGTEVPPDTHAWMIATQGDFAVAVFVEDGESGSQTAGPLLSEFLNTP